MRHRAPAGTRHRSRARHRAPGTLGDPVAGLLDVDVRGVRLPSLAQQRAAAALDAASLRWNDFGTPASILPADGVLARATSSEPRSPPPGATSPPTPRSSALAGPRSAPSSWSTTSSWSPDGGHAVLFRQRFGGLRPALGSMVTVGVADGEIAYVSSSLTRTTGTPAGRAAHRRCRAG